MEFEFDEEKIAFLRKIGLVAGFIILIVVAVFYFSGALGSFIPQEELTSEGTAKYSFYYPADNNSWTPATVNFSLFYVRNDTVYYINSTRTQSITLDITKITSEYNASGLYFLAFPENTSYGLFGTFVHAGEFHIILRPINVSIQLYRIDNNFYSNASSIPAGNHTIYFSYTSSLVSVLRYESNLTHENATLQWYGGIYHNANVTLTGHMVLLSSTAPIIIHSSDIVAIWLDNTTVALFDIPNETEIEIECSAPVTWSFSYGTF